LIQDFICNLMGYYLENKHQIVFESTNWWFLRLLELARVAGWIPLGTLLVDSTNWNKNDYESQSGQFVSMDDAEKLFSILTHLITTHKSIEGKPIAIQSDEIEMINNFLKFIKPEGVRNCCGFFIK